MVITLRYFIYIMANQLRRCEVGGGVQVLVTMDPDLAFQSPNLTSVLHFCGWSLKCSRIGIYFGYWSCLFILGGGKKRYIRMLI